MATRAKVALKDEDTVRLWWLHCNLNGETPDTSWRAFTDKVRPLIRIADENDAVTRLARALLTINDHYHADPSKLHSLADLMAFAAKKLDDNKFAGLAATLRQPVQTTQSDINGAALANP